MRLDSGLPGYTEIYHSGNQNASYVSSSALFLLVAAGVAGLAYRRYRKKEIDDDFVKPSGDGLGSTMFNKFTNPFNRRNDYDDDFDKVL